MLDLQSLYSASPLFVGVAWSVGFSKKPSTLSSYGHFVAYGALGHPVQGGYPLMAISGHRLISGGVVWVFLVSVAQPWLFSAPVRLSERILPGMGWSMNAMGLQKREHNESVVDFSGTTRATWSRGSCDAWNYRKQQKLLH